MGSDWMKSPRYHVTGCSYKLQTAEGPIGEQRKRKIMLQSNHQSGEVILCTVSEYHLLSHPATMLTVDVHSQQARQGWSTRADLVDKR